MLPIPALLGALLLAASPSPEVLELPSACPRPMPDATGAAPKGDAHASDEPSLVRALVELWWQARHLPMGAMPDRVQFYSSTADELLLQFERDGCLLATMTASRTAIWRFVADRLGRPA